MKPCLYATTALILLGVLRTSAAPAAAAAAPDAPRRSRWAFELLPKSFQKHPRLDFHVITEMTAAGRKLRPPTPEHPAYYLAQPGKFTQLGHNTPANEHAPNVTELTRAIQRALAEGGYVPSAPGSPLPQVAVVFNYGSFARFSTEFYDLQQSMALEQAMQDSDPNAPPPDPFIPSDGERDAESLLPVVLSSPEARLDVIQRAELIGGEKFAAELKKAINDEAVYRQGHEAMGSTPGMELNSPFHRFLNANEDTMSLIEESFSSCYFVVASAYDYVAMRHGQRVLLWRTKMTVNSSGIAMGESLPSLITAAGPYFGRDMATAVTLTRRIDRQGKVEVGEPVVVPDEPAPAAAAEGPGQEASGKR